MKKINELLEQLVGIFDPENCDISDDRCETVTTDSIGLLMDVLDESKKENNLNNFVTVYMSFYHLLVETEIIDQLDDSDLDAFNNDLVKGIHDGDWVDYFSCLRKSSQVKSENLDKSEKHLKKAVELISCYEAPYYYLTLIELKKNRVDVNRLMDFFNKSGSLGRLFYDGLESESLPNLKYESIDFYREYQYVLELMKSNKELKKSYLMLESANKDLENKNVHIRKVEAEKAELINKHAHNWKHIVYPQTVKKVAEDMYNRGETEVANTLFHAYNSQSLLQKDLNLLQLQYASTPKEFCRKFYQSIYTPKDRRGVGIVDVFENALQIVLFRLVMDGVDRRYETEEIKTSLFSRYSEGIIRESYVNNFIKNPKDKVSVVTWFSDNFYKLSIVNEKAWSGVKLQRDGLAYTQMTEVYIDLIHNALNHGVKTKDGFFDIIFSKEMYDGAYVYNCEIKNPVDKNDDLFEGSGQGLKSIDEIMSLLNSTTNKRVTYDHTSKCSLIDRFSYIFRLPHCIISKEK